MASLAIAGAVTGTVTPGSATVTTAVPLGQATQPNLMSVALRGRLRIALPPPPSLRKHRPLLLGTTDVMSEPVLAGGRPSLAREHAQSPSALSIQLGVGHARVVPDPDPVWGGTDWETPPPQAPSGSHFVRWTVRDLPPPSGVPGGSYPLGTLSSVDGTSAAPSTHAQWNSSAGSSYSIAWQSAYPFKPVVTDHEVFREDGHSFTIPACVLFSPHAVAHMWADFGLLLTPPFTFMTVALVNDSFGPNHTSYLLDSGEDPTGFIDTATRARWLENGIDGEVAINEQLGYRTAFQVERTQMICFNEQAPTGRRAHVPHEFTRQPKVYWGVFNGNNSSFGVWSSATHHQKTAHLLSHGAQRLAVLGRINGMLSRDRASSMAVFEIRAWDAALTSSQIQAHCQQLESTWGFGQYRRTATNGHSGYAPFVDFPL